MTERYFYSPSSKGFYPFSLMPLYEETQEGWPADAVEISNEAYSSILSGKAKGKIITNSENGYPVLIDAPEPSHEELIQLAEFRKKELIQQATQVMAPLLDAQELNLALDVELIKLDAWKKYRVLLNRVNTASAPDIEWPTPPDDLAR